MDILSAALRYTKAGLATIPIWPDSRKNPKLNSWAEYTERLPTVNEWRRWANRWPGANIGAITGFWLGYVCLDFDDINTFSVWQKSVDNWYSGQTWQVRTGRGFHVWFSFQEDPGTSRTYTLTGSEDVLLRARGGYCIVPPSMHHTGVRYTTVHRVKPLTVSGVADILPGWTEKKKAKRETETTATVPRVFSETTRIEDLVQIANDTPNSRGAYTAHCPFHPDKTPSAWVNVTQQRFGCNACWPGAWWDVVNVWSMLKNIDNDLAYKQLMNESTK
jgi:hypothetical protein